MLNKISLWSLFVFLVISILLEGISKISLLRNGTVSEVLVIFLLISVILAAISLIIFIITHIIENHF